MIAWSLLLQYFCHFLSSISLTQLSLKVKCNIDYWWCLVRWLIFYVFPKRSPTQANMSTGPDLTMINKHHKFLKWNWFRLDSFWHDISPATWATSSNTVSHFVPNPRCLGYNMYCMSQRFLSISWEAINLRPNSELITQTVGACLSWQISTEEWTMIFVICLFLY
jgi:hypothetical protein